MKPVKKMTLIYVMNPKENKTLFLLRSQKDDQEISTGKYLGVGGKVDPTDNSVYEAALRELKEETNLTAKSLQLKGIVKFIGQREQDVITNVYICTDYEGILQGDDREGTLHWIDNDKISSLNVWDGDKEFLPKLFVDELFNISLHYQNGKLVKVESHS